MPHDLNKQKAVALAIIIASYMMIILDTSIVITGLPYIKVDIHLTPVELSWMQSIYTLFFGGFLLLGARAGDIIGGRKALCIGLCIFMLTSLCIAIASSPLWLLASRAIQGLGAAFVAPSALMLISTNFSEGEERFKALSWYSSTAGIGASLGLVVGGVLADMVSWRVGFLLNLPVGGLILLFTRKFLAETPLTPNRLDVPGAILSTFGVGAVIYGVMQASTAGWETPATTIPLTAGLLILAVFFLHESRSDSPLMPLRILKHRRRAGAYMIRFLFLGAMVGFFFFSSQFMQGALKFTALQAGLGFLPMTVFAFIVALRAPALGKRLGQNTLLVNGLMLAGFGMLWLSRVTPDLNYWLGVGLPMVLIGAGQGLCFSPMTAAGIADTEVGDRGAAAGVVNVCHQLGNSVGLGVLSYISATAGGQQTNLIIGLSDSCRAVFLTGGCFLFAAVVFALVLVVPGSKPQTVTSTQR